MRARTMAAVAAAIVALLTAMWTATATAAMWSIMLVMLSSEAATRVVERGAAHPPGAHAVAAAEAPPALAGGAARTALAIAPTATGSPRAWPRASDRSPPSSEGEPEQETKSESSCTLSMVSTVNACAAPHTVGVWVPAVVNPHEGDPLPGSPADTVL